IHLSHGKSQARLDVSGNRKVNESGRLNVQSTYLAPLAIPGRCAIFEFDRQVARFGRSEAKGFILYDCRMSPDSCRGWLRGGGEKGPPGRPTRAASGRKSTNGSNVTLPRLGPS